MLKLQYFGHLMRRVDSFEKTLIELYKKDLHNPDNHDGVITHPEPEILEYKVKRISLQTKLVEGMAFQLSYFKS